MELIGFVALLRDAHSNIRPSQSHIPWTKKKIPLQFKVFSDGIYVVKANEVNQAYLGRELTHIEDMELKTVYSKLRPYLAADNNQSEIWRFESLIQFPWILYAIGIKRDDNDILNLTLISSQDKAPQNIDIHGDKNTVSEDELISVQELRDKSTFDPCFQKSAKLAYEFIPKWNSVYARIKQIEGMDNLTFSQYSYNLLEFTDEKNPDYLIIDLRGNMGGNMYLNQRLLHELIKREGVINKIGSLFVIIDKATFSAAANLATDLERETWAILLVNQRECG